MATHRSYTKYKHTHIKNKVQCRNKTNINKKQLSKEKMTSSNMKKIRLLDLQDGMRNNIPLQKKTVDEKMYQYELIDDEAVLIARERDLVEFSDN